MLLRQIKYFIAVVESGSFTEAAEKLFISQSAVSQQIRALESELGVALLIRKNRSFTLTQAGEHFYRNARILLSDAEKLKLETIRVGRGDALRLNIGYLRTYGSAELREAVTEFSARYSNIPIHIVNGNHEELYALLRTDKADFILSDQRRAFSDRYFNFKLVSCVCRAELSEHNPLAARDFATLDDLKYIPCILISSDEEKESEISFYRDALGFGGSFIFAETLDEGRLLVAGNQGFMPVEISPSSSPAPEHIVRVPIYQSGKPLTRGFYAYWKKENPNPYIKKFVDILGKAFA